MACLFVICNVCIQWEWCLVIRLSTCSLTSVCGGWFLLLVLAGKTGLQNQTVYISSRTKSGAVIGFYLRAHRICSDKFLEDELVYVTETFQRLMYPLGLFKRLRNKAVNILNKVSCAPKVKKNYLTLL